MSKVEVPGVEEVAEILTHITKEHLNDVPVSLVHPNPWNPNKEDDATYQAVRQSIRKYGFIDPVTVWPHPEIESEWMIINGEHRWRGAQEEGLATIDIIVIHGLDEAEAKKLTLSLNMGGEDDVALLGALMADLAARYEGDMDRLREALPFNEAEVKHLLEIGATDWDAFASEQAGVEARRSSVAHNKKFTAFLEFDEAQRQRYDSFIEMIGREAGDEETVETLVLAALEARCLSL